MIYFSRDVVDVFQNMNKSHLELVDKANLSTSTLETSQLRVKPAHFVALLAQRSSSRDAAAGWSNKNSSTAADWQNQVKSTVLVPQCSIILVYWFLDGMEVICFQEQRQDRNNRCLRGELWYIVWPIRMLCTGACFFNETCHCALLKSKQCGNFLQTKLDQGKKVLLVTENSSNNKEVYIISNSYN